MKLFSILFVLLPLALAEPILNFASAPDAVGNGVLELEARAENSTQKIVKNIKNAIKYHHLIIKLLDGVPDRGPITGTQIKELQNDFDIILQNLKSATQETEASPPLNNATSQHLYNELVGLKTAVFAALDDFVSHKQAFVSAGILGTVCNDIDMACAQLQQLLQAYIAIAAAPYPAMAAALANQFAAKCMQVRAALGCP